MSYHAVGNSVKDESKLHQCPDEKWEDGKKNNNNVCELFYDTINGDEGDSLEHNSDETGKKNRDDIDANGDSVDPVFYMDKNVMACDLPEIVVCYKEKTYHVVKDICVDEGLPGQDKFLFDKKDSVNSDQFGSEEVNVNTLETKSLEGRNSNDLNRDVEESSTEDAERSSNCNQDEVKNSPKKLINSSDQNVITLGDILSKEEDEQKPCNNNNGIGLEEQSSTQLHDDETHETEEKLFQDSDKTCNNSTKPETENQQQSYLLDSYEEDEKLFINGETSFSAAEVVSGHITYSGQIAISGSLSVRSDASTTSGRSFAFPILQSEWNSSPVRMAKADKRRQKGWKQSLLCCKFS